MTAATCTARDGSPAAPYCGAPALGMSVFGCVHEHRRGGPLCAGHLAAVADAHCAPCREGARPHHCPLTLVAFDEATDHPGSGSRPVGEGGTARTPGVQNPEPGLPGLGTGAAGVRSEPGWTRAEPKGSSPLRRTGGGGVCSAPAAHPPAPHVPGRQRAAAAAGPGADGGEVVRGPGLESSAEPHLPAQLSQLEGTPRVGMSDPRQDGSVGGRPQPGSGTLSPRTGGKGGPPASPGAGVPPAVVPAGPASAAVGTP